MAILPSETHFDDATAIAEVEQKLHAQFQASKEIGDMLFWRDPSDKDHLMWSYIEWNFTTSEVTPVVRTAKITNTDFHEPFNDDLSELKKHLQGRMPDLFCTDNDWTLTRFHIAHDAACIPRGHDGQVDHASNLKFSPDVARVFTALAANNVIIIMITGANTDKSYQRAQLSVTFDGIPDPVKEIYTYASKVGTQATVNELLDLRHLNAGEEEFGRLTFDDERKPLAFKRRFLMNDLQRENEAVRRAFSDAVTVINVVHNSAGGQYTINNAHLIEVDRLFDLGLRLTPTTEAYAINSAVASVATPASAAASASGRRSPAKNGPGSSDKEGQKRVSAELRALGLLRASQDNDESEDPGSDCIP